MAEPTPKQKYIAGEVRRALLSINDYLTEEQAPFALSPSDVSGLEFTFEGYPGIDQVSLTGTIKDAYFLGRVTGNIFHSIYNPDFMGLPDTPDKIHVGRVVEHCFALLLLRINDPSMNLIDAKDIYSYATDESTGYSFLKEIKDPMTGETVIDRDIKKRKEEREAYEAKKEEDDQYKSVEFEADYVDTGSSIPELQRYSAYDAPSDDALEMTLAKMENEAFGIAVVIVEGRGDRNWRKTIDEVLRMDLNAAKIYLAELLDY